MSPLEPRLRRLITHPIEKLFVLWVPPRASLRNGLDLIDVDLERSRCRVSPKAGYCIGDAVEEVRGCRGDGCIGRPCRRGFVLGAGVVNSRCWRATAVLIDVNAGAGEFGIARRPPAQPRRIVASAVIAETSLLIAFLARIAISFGHVGATAYGLVRRGSIRRVLFVGHDAGTMV